jgi:hypothetical protein
LVDAAESAFLGTTPFISSFPPDSADSKQLDSNSLESIKIESIAQIPTITHSDSGPIVEREINEIKAFV